MKNLIKLTIAALVALLTGQETTTRQKLIAGAIIAAITVAILFFTTGCMATTDLDGKRYSIRIDVLTPIGQTANGIMHFIPLDPNAASPR